MEVHELARARWTRWRWRLRGAVMWPTFAACLVLDTFILHRLPISGAATSVPDAFIEAGFFNLVAVAVFGPMLSLGLRRWRRDLPRVVARDHAGTAALLVVTVVVVGAGLLNRQTVVAAERSFRAQGLALRSYVLANAPSYGPNLGHADTVQLDANFYRTCVPADNPATALCLFIDTSHSPAVVRRDPNRDPNSPYFLGRPGDFSGS